MIRLHSLAPAVAFLWIPALAPAATYRIDPAHSSAQFTVRHMMVSNVTGFFQKLSCTVEWDPNNLAQSRVEVVIEAGSVDTRNEGRDKHLRSADFFDVANNPTITYRSRRIEQAGSGKLRITGDLTLRGVTKEVVLDVEGPTPEIQAQGRFRMGASAATRINRKDFGVNWSGTMDSGGVVVSDEVRINLEVELIRTAAAPAAAN